MGVYSEQDCFAPNLYVELPARTIAGRHSEILNEAEDPVAAHTNSPVHSTDSAVVVARMAGSRTFLCQRKAAPSLSGRIPCFPRDSDLVYHDIQGTNETYTYVIGQQKGGLSLIHI